MKNITTNFSDISTRVNGFGQPVTELPTAVLRGKSTAAGNSTLAIGGVSSPLESFVVAESSVLRTNFCAEKPAHRQSAKRYLQGYKTENSKLKIIKQ